MLLVIGAFYLSLGISENDSMRGTFIAGMVVTGIYSFHQNRQDLRFIRTYLPSPTLQIVLNYNLLILPCSAALLLNHQWWLAAAIHIAVSITAITSRRTRSRTMLFLERFIPAHQFEWLSGLRRHFFLIVVLILVAIFLSPVKLFGVVALFLINTVFLGFYSLSEPLVMLNPDFLEPCEFLKQKIQFLNRIVLSINLPLLAVNSLVHPESAWFAACFLIGTLLLNSSIVFIKYAQYQPNVTQGFSIDQLILFAGLLVPYLLPLSFYVYYNNRQKAITTLQHYQNDSH
ncbi:MAG: hypothetical protein JNL60_17960 [Bacteroidia bacterium]|nr:hypothetical protein [Bacteroidia bacterium]